MQEIEKIRGNVRRYKTYLIFGMAILSLLLLVCIVQLVRSITLVREWAGVSNMPDHIVETYNLANMMGRIGIPIMLLGFVFVALFYYLAMRYARRRYSAIKIISQRDVDFEMKKAQDMFEKGLIDEEELTSINASILAEFLFTQ